MSRAGPADATPGRTPFTRTLFDPSPCNAVGGPTLPVIWNSSRAGVIANSRRPSRLDIGQTSCKSKLRLVLKFTTIIFPTAPAVLLLLLLGRLPQNVKTDSPRGKLVASCLLLATVAAWDIVGRVTYGCVYN